MGCTVTPTYVIRITQNYRGSDTIVWNTKLNGAPTAENLIKWRKAMNESFNLGGVNEHITKSLGHIARITGAALVNQKTCHVIALDNDATVQII